MVASEPQSDSTLADRFPVNAALTRLEKWLATREGAQLECKEAKSRYDFEKLVKYAAAIANEGGGVILLGVTDAVPHQVVGTAAFEQPERTVAGLVQRLRLYITCETIAHPNGRVLAFQIPPAPLGHPVAVDGAYLMRAGDDLAPMSPDRLRQLLFAGEPDFSATINPQARLDDLDSVAVAVFRRRWQDKSGNAAIADLNDDQALADCGLIVDGQVTHAALILFGKAKRLDRLMAQAEIIYEFRTINGQIHYDFRREYRNAFFLIFDELWKVVADRCTIQQFQQGFFREDIPDFTERVVREAILNAVGHRDYQSQGSIFLRHSPRLLRIESPGGLPAGITPETIVYRQHARNRLLADAFARCGLIERSGQGADLMFSEAIRAGKALPTFTGTDDHQVAMTLHGETTDPAFVRFLQAASERAGSTFGLHDLLALDALHQGATLSEHLRERMPRLEELGAIERLGGGQVLLARSLYQELGKAGVYTRRKGLDRHTNLELLVKHLADSGDQGAPLTELMQVLPSATRSQVQGMLRDLRSAGRIQQRGRTRGGRWFIVVPQDQP